MSVTYKKGASEGRTCNCGNRATTKVNREFVCDECADELYECDYRDRPSRDNKNRKVRFRDE